MNSISKTRLDQFLVDSGRYQTRSRAADAIRRGCVKIGGKVETKTSANVSSADAIEIADEAAYYVSRAALKLKAGLAATGFSPAGLIALDIGASTGGFTQVLLEEGAAKVIAIDVGHDQMDPVIACDPRVTNLEGINARDLSRENIGAEAIGFLVSDVSFISLKTALPAALKLAAPGAHGIFLVKPQFEVGREHIGKGGIVRDAALAEQKAREVASWIGEQNGWRLTHFLASPIEGGEGNHEYLAGAVKDRTS